jgi:hypothetical protein
MPLTAYLRVLFGLAQTLHGWIAALAPLDRASRRRIAHYAQQIAETLARAAETLNALESNSHDR